MDAESLKRWVKDRVISYNDDIDEHPKKTMARLQKEVAGIHPDGRLEAVRFAKDYANAYYGGRHGHEIPADMKRSIREFETKVLKMNSVEASRDYIRQAGSPEQFIAGLMEQSRQKRAVQSALASSFDQRVRLNVSPGLKPSLDKRVPAPTAEVEQKKTATRGVGIGR